jgi:D-alanine-D-alanine ligase
MEIVFKNPETKHPIYSFDFKLDWAKEVEYVVPAKVTPELQAELVRVARKVYSALGCRDVARIDLRLDQNGVVNFIECNPLPGMAPGWSDLCLIATAAGMDYRGLVSEILAPAVRRLRQKRRAAAASGTMPPPPPPEPNIPIVEVPQDG